ncbi:MAG: VOC family protein [Bacteroidetes bacterium]|nr:VOC family protein [Bacteroidota bacterium]
MIKYKRLRHIALVVKDIENIIDFYTNILGFKLRDRYIIESEDIRKGIGLQKAKAKGAHLMIPNSDIELELFEFEKNIEKKSEEYIASHPGYRHIAIVVENLKETYEELKSKNVSFISEPISVNEPACFKGFQFVYMKDPEGNIIEFNQLPERKSSL